MAEIKRAKEALELYLKAEKTLYDVKNYEKALAELSEVLELLPNDDDYFTKHLTNSSQTISKCSPSLPAPRMLPVNPIRRPL